MISLVIEHIQVGRDVVRPRRLEIQPALEMVIGQLSGIGKHAISLVERFYKKLRHKGRFALAAFAGKKHHLSEKQPANNPVQLWYTCLNARQLVYIHRLNVRQFLDVGYRRGLGVFHRLTNRARPISPQNIVSVLLPKIICHLYRLDWIGKPLLQGIQQRNLSALAIAEYNDLLKLDNPVPHILQKCETIAAVWNADRIAYSGLGYR